MNSIDRQREVVRERNEQLVRQRDARRYKARPSQSQECRALSDEGLLLSAKLSQLQERAQVLKGCEVVVQAGQLLPRLEGRAAEIDSVIATGDGLLALLRVPRKDGSGYLDTGPADMRRYIPVAELVFA